MNYGFDNVCTQYTTMVYKQPEQSHSSSSSIVEISIDKQFPWNHTWQLSHWTLLVLHSFWQIPHGNLTFLGRFAVPVAEELPDVLGCFSTGSTLAIRRKLVSLKPDTFGITSLSWTHITFLVEREFALTLYALHNFNSWSFVKHERNSVFYHLSLKQPVRGYLVFCLISNDGSKWDVFLGFFLWSHSYLFAVRFLLFGLEIV